MVVQENFLTIDNFNILTRIVQPENPPINGVFVLIHGIGDHSGRYFEWLSLFSSQDIVCITADLPGHGHSSGKRGHIGSMETIHRLIENLLNSGKKLFPSKPLILCGHSMGGNIVANYALTGKIPPDGIILLAPWFGLINPPGKIALRLAKLLLPFFPKLTLSTRMRRNQLCDDKEPSAHLDIDPMIHGKISLQTFMEMWNSLNRIYQSPLEIHQPLLILHGTADQITDWSVSQKVAQNIGLTSTFIPLDGMLHVLHIGNRCNLVAEIILQWFTKNFSYGNSMEH